MKYLMLLSLLFLVGCGANDSGAYVEPYGDCGYIVRIGNNAPRGNDQLSKCLSLKEATDLAAQINNDMSGKWAGTYYSRR